MWTMLGSAFVLIKCHFCSLIFRKICFAMHWKVLMEYHDKVASKKKRQSKDLLKDPRKTEIKEVKPKDAKVESVEKDEQEMDDAIVHCEFLSESYIRKRNLLPKEVLYITHIKGDEKNLVAQIKFDGVDDPAFVFSKWANKHCPQLVIGYYERRIRWEKKT